MNFKIMKNKTLNCELVYVTDSSSNIWFRGKTVAEILGYGETNTVKAINKHVDSDDRKKCKQISGTSKMEPLTYNQKNTIFINESGLYSLILSSKLPKAKVFKRWVTKDVLPTIRKTGAYQMEYPVKQKLTFKIENEFDLHTKVVNFLKNNYPDSLFIATLGENQDSVSKRIKSSLMGYMAGAPDLLILNHHVKYNGFAIEFKTPTGKGIVSDNQSKFINKFKKIGNYKTLVTNDYDKTIIEIIEYFRDVRICCEYCKGKFKTNTTLSKHHKGFHKIM